MTAAVTQTKDERRKEFGKDISFGIQQTLACWATDFIDPYVGEKIQERFEVKGKHEMPPGSTWLGEIVGDSAALFAFLGVQKFFPSLTRGLKRAVRATFNPLLENTGKKNLKEWAREEHVAPGSPEYQKKMEEWKDFQADNIAKSAIISGSSIAFNVGTQKAIGNTHKIGVILMAKVAGAVITVAGMLGLRFAIPKTTKSLDEELSHRYFAPVIRWTQKVLGAEVDENQPLREQNHKREPQKSHVEKITSARIDHMAVQHGR